ncbi:MAG TPA: hypothetical protein PLF59_20660 [Cyclobacteriaceae bacterium]|nr:hypothetical protein [Cyclobacteriaceae bacterium]
MDKQYIILSLKHSRKDEPVFWCANDAGYTNSPFNAGRYTEAQIKESPRYYNDGFNSIAIPLTTQGLQQCGLKFSLNENEVKKFHSINKI